MTTRQVLNRARLKGFGLLFLGSVIFMAGPALSRTFEQNFTVFLLLPAAVLYGWGLCLIMFAGRCVHCGKGVGCVLGPLIQLWQMQQLISFCPRCGKSVDTEPRGCIVYS